MSSFTCPHCGQKLRAPEGARGGKFLCRRCCQVLTVPPPTRTVQRPSDHGEAATVAPYLSPGGPAADDATGHEQATVPPSEARGDTHGGGAGPKGGADPLTDFLAPPQGPEEIGRLGPYRILKVLGAGGMGVVYLAEDPKLRRRVALKAILPSLAAGAAARERFLREARAAAAVEHDHIVAVHQVDEDRGVPYLVMPLLRGETLEARLRREKRLPLADVLRIARQAAEGLEAARRGGLVHRDVKPANLWLEEGTGRVKILDFGLARSHDDTKRLTQLGALIGTPAYMAPEQAAGQGDHRADLFSLGCVLYRMATGEPAFPEADMISTIAAVAADPVRPPREVNPALPPALSDLILRLLAKKPGERPASAQAVVEAIRAIQAALKGNAKAAPPPVAPAPVVAPAPRVVETAPPVRHGRGGLWLFLALVLAGGLAVGGYFLWKAFGPPAVAVAPPAPPAPPNTAPDGMGQPNQPGPPGDPSGKALATDPADQLDFHLIATSSSMRDAKEEIRALTAIDTGAKEKLLGALDDAITQLKVVYKEIYGKELPYIKPDVNPSDKDNRNLRHALREVDEAKKQLRAAKGATDEHRDAALAALDEAKEKIKDALDAPPPIDDLPKDKDPKSLSLPSLTSWAMLPDGRTLIVGLRDGNLVYIDTVAVKEIKRVKAPVRPDLLAAQGKRLFVALKGAKVVHLLDRDSGEDLKKEIPLPDDDLTALFSGPEPGPVYAALPKGLAAIDADAGAAAYLELRGQTPPFPDVKMLPRGVAFEPLGKYLPRSLAFDPNHADTLYVAYSGAGPVVLWKFTIKGNGLTLVGANYTAGLVNLNLPDAVSVGVSHDGKFVGVSASGGYRPPGAPPPPAGEAAVGVFTADDVSAHGESVACGVVPRDLAFHPVLDLGVAEQAWLGPTGRHLHLFNSTSLVEVAKFDIPYLPNNSVNLGARLLTFGGWGTKLIYYDGTTGVLHLIPLTLTKDDREALAKAYLAGGK